MRGFGGTFFICLVVIEIFFFFGGGLLFDLSRHYYLSGAVIAFLLATAISIWLKQEDRLDTLEKRVQALENGDKINLDKENAE